MSPLAQHVAARWLVQLTFGSLAITLGFMPWFGWLLLVAYLMTRMWLLSRLLLDRDEGCVGIAPLALLLGQAPGLVLAIWVVASMIAIVPTALAPMVCLQWWTAVVTPVISLLHGGVYRSYYVWLTLALPVADLEAETMVLLRSRHD